MMISGLDCLIGTKVVFYVGTNTPLFQIDSILRSIDTIITGITDQGWAHGDHLIYKTASEGYGLLYCVSKSYDECYDFSPEDIKAREDKIKVSTGVQVKIEIFRRAENFSEQTPKYDRVSSNGIEEF